MTLDRIQTALDGDDLPTAQMLVQELRARVDALPEERSTAAIVLAAAMYERDLLVEAEVWALRALQGDLRVDALCLLGEIAWERLDYESAIGFYEAAGGVTRVPQISLDLVPNKQRRLEEMYEDAVKLVRPVRFVDRQDEDHILVIQTTDGRVAQRAALSKSLQSAGVERWRGPKVLLADGDEKINGFSLDAWKLFRTDPGGPWGQAKAFFEALYFATNHGTGRITFFEDDVVLAKNALDYIARVQPPEDAIISWWNRMPAPFRAGPPVFLQAGLSFVRNVAFSMSGAHVRQLLDSQVVKNWTARHGADMVYEQALLGVQAALHFPGIVQHAGTESAVGNPEIRRSCSFIGEEADALQLMSS